MECFLPQAWCNQWEQSEREGGMYRRKGGERCAFRDVVLSGFAVALRQNPAGNEMEERMAAAGVDISNKGEVLRHLGRRRIWGGLESSELLREFYLLGRGAR